MVSTRQMSITTVGPEAGNGFSQYYLHFIFFDWMSRVVNCLICLSVSLVLLLSIWFDWFWNGQAKEIITQDINFIYLFVEILGSTGVNANGGSSRMTSNSLSQQNSSSNTTRQQSNHGSANSTAMGDATRSNMGSVIVPACQNQLQLTDMPVEIFERIFQYSGYKEVSNMRLVNETKHINSNQKCDSAQIVNVFHFAISFQVSTQTNQICKTILNSTFTKLQTQLMKRFQNIKKIMPRR